MANNSCIGFCMRNQKLFQELKKSELISVMTEENVVF